MEKRFLLSSDSKNLSAIGEAANAAFRSSGTMIVLWGAYAADQRPSVLAASICSNPAALSLPWARKRSTAAQLTCDHLLLGPRGVKRWHHHPSVLDLVWPSIQPKQRAVSSACAWVIEGRSFSFLANSNHRPRDPALCFSSQLCQAAVVATRFFTSTLVSVMGCELASMFPPILPCSVGRWHRSSLCVPTAGTHRILSIPSEAS